jgi:hypothetical protein
MTKNGENLINTSIYSAISMTSKFIIKKCKNKAGWSLVPYSPTTIEFNQLLNIGTIIIQTQRILIIKYKGKKFTIHRYGEIKCDQLKRELLEEFANLVFNK